jgi:2-keto-3-deoxy-L-rhamnonate aldolase RhmA
MRSAVFLLSFLVTSVASVQGQDRADHGLVRLLSEGKYAFGSVVQDKSEAGGRALAVDPRVDFAFYSMEEGPFDLEALNRFLRGARTVATKSVLVRIPPIGTDRQGARARVSALLTLGVDGIVFPHTQSPEEAAFGVSLLKAGTRGVWPLDRRANGVIGYFLIEDQDAVANVRDIARTPGIGMLSGGQGSLKQAFKGDAAQVEAALTSILDACKSAQIACATGVSETDVAHRFEQGFRVFMASGPALDQGRRLARR